MYQKCLSEVLELPWGASLLDDARTKLVTCFGFVNKELVMFHEFQSHGLVVRSFKDNGERPPKVYNEAEIKSIELWTPETGAYKTFKGGVIVLYKRPRRQWHKSFKPENYEFFYAENTAPPDYLNIVPGSRSEFWVSRRGDLWFLDTKIGKMKEDGESIECSSVFKQDVEDWIRNGKERSKDQKAV